MDWVKLEKKELKGALQIKVLSTDENTTVYESIQQTVDF